MRPGQFLNAQWYIPSLRKVLDHFILALLCKSGFVLVHTDLTIGITHNEGRSLISECWRIAYHEFATEQVRLVAAGETH